MGKKNSRLLNKIYQKPLPIDVAVNVAVVLTNPISWFEYVWNFIRVNLWNTPDVSKIDVVCDNGVFKVVNADSMVKLWREGFFGKGVLSRSEPTWHARTVSRLNGDADDGKSSGVAMEDVTKSRRHERIEFKRQRQRLQDLQLKQRKGLIEEEEVVEMAKLDEQLVEFRRKDFVNVEEAEVGMRDEDADIIDGKNGSVVQLEYMQLQAVEVFFLQFALDKVSVCDISLKQLFIQCCQQYEPSSPISSNNKFIVNYVVYHYFRSKGWCVRSGIKFGTDYLLYKRGPPFSHAEFCVSVMQDNHQNDTSLYDWFQICARARVIGSVKKNFVQVYVVAPLQAEFDEVFATTNIDEGLMFRKLLSMYKVSEVLYRRWNPSRTRD
ncbi:SEN2 [Candida theae]|uniref:tRNA-splicing endonuclease subunit Sen2 n=1 Tax=Candida theae TaxID=1198502 RepID=A0AAD5FWT4_9ASCO|nr:SEN2 [Candida theae]KAI5949256.1 SEN2 [Candida theae]